MPETATLLLKLNQSVLSSWPELLMEALGRLVTKALVVVLMLKLLPAVPVLTLLMLLMEPKPKVEVETKRGAPAPLDWRICPAVPAKVDLRVIPS